MEYGNFTELVVADFSKKPLPMIECSPRSIFRQGYLIWVKIVQVNTAVSTDTDTTAVTVSASDTNQVGSQYMIYCWKQTLNAGCPEQVATREYCGGHYTGRDECARWAVVAMGKDMPHEKSTKDLL